MDARKGASNTLGVGRPRTGWRKGLYAWLYDYEWPIFGTITLLVLILGCVGFARRSAVLGQGFALLDVLYRSLQLFTLESGSVEGVVPWELQAARLLAPVLAAYAAAKALAVIFRVQIQHIRARVLKDHVVVCGLGRKGSHLSRTFSRTGYRVVIIEKNPENSLLDRCDEHDAIILVGDATRADMLVKAGVHKAKCVFSVCGDDGTNAEIAVRARELVRHRKRAALTCLAHIVEFELCKLLREKEVATRKVDASRLEFFNVYESGARALLNAHPLHGAKYPVPPRQEHVLVVGIGRMGESLVVRACRDWRDAHGERGTRLRITVADKNAEARKESLCLQYPQLEKVCDLAALQIDVQSPEFDRADFLFDAHGGQDVTAVYICLNEDSLCLRAALDLHRQARKRGRAIPIVVRMDGEAGLATLLRRESDSDDDYQSIRAFSLLEQTCQPDLLIGGVNEIVARAIHEDYCRQQAETGETAASDPSMVPWDELPESLRESNRCQADHTAERLGFFGYGIAPLTHWDAEQFAFQPTEVEKMAEMEHERWHSERRQAGYSYAPGPKDPERKTHPDLLPWKQLPEDVKEKKRNMIRRLPAFLAKAGFQVESAPRTNGPQAE